MAQDIVPVQLSLTAGDLVTLWAPGWREDGEEWEAFLGHGAALYAFPEVAQLAAFVRTSDGHDLTDHPAWHVVPELSVAELTPEETHRYDVVGVPELAAAEPDVWALGELAEVVGILGSLADVCDLPVVHEVLESAEGFGLLPGGMAPFSGREGHRRWNELAALVARRWDEVLDALDALVRTPELDAAALAAARAEVETAAAEAGTTEAGTTEARPAGATLDADFWAAVGIDPISVTTSDGEYLTLRCYLDEDPLFLGSDGRIEVFGSGRALARWLAGEGRDGHDLATVSTWPDVVGRAGAGELEVTVSEDNRYVLSGVADDLAAGPESTDPAQLELAVELVTDAGDWAGDPRPHEALAPTQRLGWLVSFVLRPSPTRLIPSPPFTEEVDAWRALENAFTDRLRRH